MHNNCKFTDKQFVKFQELNNYVAEGETPSSIAVLAYDSNVDSFRPGDRVEMVGIYRAYGVKIDRSRSNLKAVFNTYIDLLSCSMLEENRFQVQEQKTVFSDQERR
jgi:DNA replicative helicase MCM subunit Mcm2 (Cdc46/Mcm family)